MVSQLSALALISSEHLFLLTLLLKTLIKCIQQNPQLCLITWLAGRKYFLASKPGLPDGSQSPQNDRKALQTASGSAGLFCLQLCSATAKNLTYLPYVKTAFCWLFTVKVTTQWTETRKSPEALNPSVMSLILA